MSLSHLKDFIYKFIVPTFIMELSSKVDIFDTMNEVNSIYRVITRKSHSNRVFHSFINDLFGIEFQDTKMAAM